MNRVGFLFKIRPGLKNEYKKAHDEIWPELIKAMTDCGIHNYSIYFREDGTCFAYMEIEGDFDKQMANQHSKQLYLHNAQHYHSP